jgi:hypothetical protein
MAEPNDWDENTQQGIRFGLRKFYERWMDQKFPWETPGPGMLPLVEDTLLKDWADRKLFYMRGRQGWKVFRDSIFVGRGRWMGFLCLPLWDAWVARRAFFLFFAYPSWGAVKVTTDRKTLIRHRARLYVLHGQP